LRAESDQPIRLWVQIRAAGEAGGQRWGRSFYLDPSLRTIDLRLESFRAMDPASTLTSPPLERIDSLLLVIDTLNTLPGARGTIRIPDLWLVR
jgi:hypothetical protein